LQLLDWSIAPLPRRNLLADELLSAAASAAVGTSPPVIPSPSQDPQKVRLELLMLADHSFSTPHRPSPWNLAAIFLPFFSDEPRAYLKGFEKFQGLSCKIPEPPTQFKSCELQKYVKICRKYRKMSNQLGLNPCVKYYNFCIMIMR
jgi:hypothetical protein